MSSPALPPKASIHSPDNLHAENDPFLAQSSSISLTARDRQEGYDVDLLNSAPRVSGRSSAAPIPSTLGEKSYGTTPTNVPLRERDHLIVAGDERAHSDNSHTPHKKPWYLRPLALGVVACIVLIVALGLGLGFGLGLKHDSAQDAAKAASESYSYVPPVSTTTQTGSPIVNTLASGQQRASPVSNRTAVPSSASPSTTLGPSVVALSAPVSGSPTLVASASIFNFNASSAIPSGVRNTPVPASEALTRTLGVVVEPTARRRRKLGGSY